MTPHWHRRGIDEFCLETRIGARFKYHDDCVTNCMKVTRSILQSCNITVGMATDELNPERDGEVNGTGSPYTGSVLKSEVW